MYSLSEARQIALKQLESLITLWQDYHGTTEGPTLDDIRHLLSEE